MYQNPSPGRCRASRTHRRRNIGRPFFFLCFLALCLFFAGFFVGRSSASPTPVAQAGFYENNPEQASPGTSPVASPEENRLPEELPWNLTLVNRETPLPAEFTPGLSPIGGHQFDSRAVGALQQMLDDAKAQGLSPIICSSYRSIAKQQDLYEEMVQTYLSQGHSREEAEKRTGSVIAFPGTSEHNLGLAVDIVALSYQLLEADQEETAEAQWLHARCHEYGFILRYPKDKEAVTGIIYEPWHYRYVGVEHAARMKETGLCLEEYLTQYG